MCRVGAQVLRSFAYFKEAVHESAAEDTRVRKCTILLYLVVSNCTTAYKYLHRCTVCVLWHGWLRIVALACTNVTLTIPLAQLPSLPDPPQNMEIQVVEHKDENAGMPQGTFVKRHRIPKKTAGDFYEWTDLQVGNDVTFYGRTMHIVDCDPFTRDFFASNGMDQPEAEPYPGDSYKTLRTSMQMQPQRAGYYGKQNNPLKKFMEASLGKVASGRGEAENLKQFLDNDRKVLRFYCEWDDTGRLYGDKVRCALPVLAVVVMRVTWESLGRVRASACCS